MESVSTFGDKLNRTELPRLLGTRMTPHKLDGDRLCFSCVEDDAGETCVSSPEATLSTCVRWEITIPCDQKEKTLMCQVAVRLRHINSAVCRLNTLLVREEHKDFFFSSFLLCNRVSFHAAALSCSNLQLEPPAPHSPMGVLSLTPFSPHLFLLFKFYNPEFPFHLFHSNSLRALFICPRRQAVSAARA